MQQLGKGKHGKQNLKDFKRRNMADYIKSIRQVRTGEAMHTRVSGKGWEPRSESVLRGITAGFITFCSALWTKEKHHRCKQPSTQGAREK